MMQPVTENQESAPVTASTLLNDDSLELSLIVPGSGLNMGLVGHHATDLTHPSRYLFPGELLLTNGLWLPDRTATEWITDVKSAGSVAVAFGLNESFPAIPREVITACRELDFTLIAVPVEISFSKITDVIHAADASVEAVRLQLNRLRRIGRELTASTGLAELIELINRETGLRCWLAGPGGRCLAGVGDAPDQTLLRLAVRLARNGHLSGTLGNGLCSFTAGRAKQSDLALVVETMLKDISDESRWIIETVLPHFLIDHAERRAEASTRSALMRELVELIWTGNIAAEAFAARMRTMDLDPYTPTTVIASGNDLEDVADAVDGSGINGVITSYEGTNILIMQANSDKAIEQIAEIIKEGGRDPILGTGIAGIGTKGLRRSLAQALPAWRSALTRKPGDRVVRQFDVGSYAGLLHFVDHAMLWAFRDALLGPLIDWDQKHDADLVHTLRTFLEHDGKWRQAARELHIHHNTLKYRIEKVSYLTGRDLTQASSRIDFTLALSIPRASP